MITGKSLTALGSGGLKPEIHVTAKAGALLNLHYKDSSIILQSYQLEAEETQHTFVVSVSETAYVVDDATNNASVEVLVDVVAQYNAEIMYVLWLYREGDECEDITGGWVFCPWPSSSYYANGTMTKNDTSILLSSNAAQFAGARPSNKIDLTNYSKIVFIVDSNTKSGKYSYSALDVYSSLSAFGGANREAYVDLSPGQTGIFEVGISSLSGSKYIVCSASADTSSSSTLQFTGMYLI